MTTRNWEYSKKGDYHKNLNKKWRYYPIYLTKMDMVKRFLANYPKDKNIIDLGCGEGVLVEEFQARGYQIKGIDANYESAHVRIGDITNTKLPDKSCDLVLCLDVLEHLEFQDQPKALKEIFRILKNDGLLFISIANLAHLLSRISFLLTGRLIRTSTPDRHPTNQRISGYDSKRFFHTKKKGNFPHVACTCNFNPLYSR